MSLVQDLRADGISAIAVHPKGDKVMRMNAQLARIEAGSVWLPERAHWLEDFRHELMAFPAGRYDDQVDALSQALARAFERGARLFVSTVRGLGGAVAEVVGIGWRSLRGSQP